MTKKTKIILILLINTIFVINSKMLIKEDFYNGNSSEIIATRFFKYNKHGFITKIIETSKSNTIIELRYTYDGDLMKSVELFNNKLRISYSIFYYQNRILRKKIDYDNNEKEILIHNYKFSNNEIIEITDEKPEGTYLGKKVFIYKDGHPYTEKIENDTADTLIIKKYIIEENMIRKIEYFMNNSLIRVVEKTYSPENIETNNFSYPYNFWDLK